MEAPRKILVVKNKHIGDIILSQPAFWALHRAFPNAQLDVLISPGTRELMEGFPWIHNLLETPRKTGVFQRLGRELQLAWMIATERYELFVDLTWSDRAMLYAALSRARQRWAIQVTAGSFLKPYVYNNFGGKPDRAWHVIEHERQFLLKMGLPTCTPEFFFPETAAESARIRSWLSQVGLQDTRLVVVHPTSRWLFKCWNDEKVAGLLDWLATEGWQPVLTSGPSDKEMSKAQRILAQAQSKPHSRIGNLTLRELAALLRQAQFFFGIDSAPMHLAAAVGCRAVVLFGPSQVNRWRPYGENHVVITAECPCLALRQPACDKTKVMKCLDSISLRQVQEAITRNFRRA